jgi:prolyl oligopeptidase
MEMAQVDEVVDVLHGVEVHDPYRWLEDGDSEETKAWTEAQNKHTRQVLDALPDRPALCDRFDQLLRAGSSGGPRVRRGRIFSVDSWGDLDQAVLVVRSASEDTGDVEPKIVFDPHAATGDKTAAIDWYHPSPDGRLVAYGLSTGGDERSTLRILDVETGEHLPDEIPDTLLASLAWWPDNSGFAYSRFPAGEDYGRHIRTHTLGDDPADDPVLHDASPDPSVWTDVTIDEGGRWYLIYEAHGSTRNDVHLIEREAGTSTTVIEGVEALSFFEIVGDRLIGTTTVDADRGRVVAAPLTTPTPDHWETLVPESDAVIDGVAITPQSLMVASSLRATSRLDRYDHYGLDRTTIELPELGSLGGFSASKDDDLVAFTFTGFARPSTMFRWTPSDGARARQWSHLPGAPDPTRYQVEQHTYASTDGTDVGIFVISGAGTTPDPTTATILTGYGGFGVTMSPAWSPMVVAHCDAGGAYAVACIRGGSEEGEAWHRAGIREHKQQAFDDFYAAADWLVAEGRTSPDRLAIRGGSNGGLLMGAAVTQRPDLCRAVHCAVPLLDMVRFPLFRIAKLWVPEYGDPDEAEDFAWLYAYSPYHHVVKGTRYPAQLITTGLEDSRVDPCHARKFVAAMQAATGSDLPVLLSVETEAGHGQGKPKSKQVDESADVLAFLHWQLGVRE